MTYVTINILIILYFDCVIAPPCCERLLFEIYALSARYRNKVVPSRSIYEVHEAKISVEPFERSSKWNEKFHFGLDKNHLIKWFKR